MAIKTNNGINIKLLAFTVFVGAVLLFIKFVAYYFTHSNAILGDALESIVNVVAGFISLLSVIIASIPKDSNHPYGHGKVEFLSAAFEGGFIAIAGLAIIFKAIYNLFFPVEIHQIDLGIALTIATSFINFALGYILVIKGKQSHSVAMVASGEHLKTDTYTSMGLIAGLVLIWLTNIFWIDQIVAIILGLFIMFTGYNIVKKALSGILDETDLELIDEIAAILEKNRNVNWIDIHNMRIIKYGASLHIDCHVTLPYYLDLKQAHAEVTAIENLVNNKMPNNTEFFIHTDPCEPFSCSVCSISNCNVRSAPFVSRITWDRNNIIINKKHFK